MYICDTGGQTAEKKADRGGKKRAAEIERIDITIERID